MSSPMPIEPEKLKPVLHEKIERMDAEQLYHIGARHVQLQIAAQDVPRGTLEL